MSQVKLAVLLFSRTVVSSFLILPIMFLALVILPTDFSSAQEDETTVEICSPASTVIIATDGGLVDISALDDSEVARVAGAKASAESVVSKLKEACGFTSFVLVDGNGSQGPTTSSAASVRASDKYIDPLSAALLEACNYSVAIVEVQKDDICVDIPVCSDDRAHPWLDKEAHPWLDKDAHPWLDNKGFVWSDNRAHPWLDLNASPWISQRDLCIDDLGYLWSGGYGYLWSGGYGYLWSGGYGYLWSGGYGYLWSGAYTPPSAETKASPWLEAETRGVPWVD